MKKIKQWWHEIRSRNVYPKYRIVFTRGKFFAQIQSRKTEDWKRCIGKDLYVWFSDDAIDRYCAFETRDEAVDVIKMHVIKSKQDDEFNRVEVIDVYISR